MRITIFHPECLYDTGKRPNQEDSVYPSAGSATEDSRLFIVCDGMGGHNNGEVASQTVCNSISSYINEHWDGDVLQDQLLIDALHEAISQINKLDDGSPQKPGTTMTFLCIHRGGILAAHIGDSRIYHIRPTERRILYKSRDHSLAYDMFLAGEITKNEIATYPKKSVLTRTILPNQERLPKPDIVHIKDIQSGDYFILATDGIFETMTDDELISLMCEEITNKEKCQKLSLMTQDNADNHSAYMIKVKEVEVEEGDEQFADDEATVRYNAILLEGSPTPSKQSFASKVINKIKVLCK